jgi:hypothetical protein
MGNTESRQAVMEAEKLEQFTELETAVDRAIATCDGDGWAEFPIIDAVLGGGAIHITTVWVNGEEVSDDDFTPSDGDTFSFTIAD